MLGTKCPARDPVGDEGIRPGWVLGDGGRPPAIPTKGGRLRVDPTLGGVDPAVEATGGKGQGRTTTKV